MGDHKVKCARGDSAAQESWTLVAKVVPHVEGDGRRSFQACEDSPVDGPGKRSGVQWGTINGSLGMWSQHGNRWWNKGMKEYYSGFCLIDFILVKSSDFSI